jgi:drug/metabolite transporter (DMT)-like permease
MGKILYNWDLICANLLFGANFSFFVSLTKYYLDFRQILMLQILASALFFVPFAIFSERSYRITLRDFGNIFVVSLLIVYGWMYMLLWGASYTNPIDAATISTLGPVFTLVFARLVRRTPILPVRVVGVVCAFVGAGVLLFDNGFVFAHGSNNYGNAIVLVAIIAIAINTVIIKPQLERLGTLVVMGWYYIIGLAITAPFFWRYVAHTPFLRLPMPALAELLYILLLGTVLPMFLLYRGAEKLTFVHTALYRYLQPVVATALALLRHQEKLDRANIVAAVFIFVGVLLISIAGVRRATRE